MGKQADPLPAATDVFFLSCNLKNKDTENGQADIFQFSLP